MQFPKIMLLAIGGTHGDFLLNCCKLMLQGSKFETTNQGSTVSSSVYKNQHFMVGGKRVAVDYSHLTNQTPLVELSHMWYEEYKTWNTQFYFIEFNDTLIPKIKEMWINKVCGSNIDVALESYKKAWSDSISKNFSRENFDEIFAVLSKRTKKLFMKQPGIISIDMVKLYDYSSLVDVLKSMGIYNADHEHDLQEIHGKWRHNNLDNIEQIKSILAK